MKRTFAPFIPDGHTVTIPRGEFRRLCAIEAAARVCQDACMAEDVDDRDVTPAFDALFDTLAALRVRFDAGLAARLRAEQAALAAQQQADLDARLAEHHARKPAANREDPCG